MSAPIGHRVEVTLAGTTCSFECGRIAKLATGSVVGRCGDNVVLATVVEGPAKAGVDFFPLTVEYREKLAAVGRIPGSYGRREGRATAHGVLVSRLIDRTGRSLFPGPCTREFQPLVEVLSGEPASDVQGLAPLTAWAALRVGPGAVRGPAAGLRLGGRRGTFLPFPG